MVGAYNDFARALLTRQIAGARLLGIYESLDAYPLSSPARRRPGSSRGRCHERINKSKTGSKPRLFRGLFKLGDRRRQCCNREHSDSVAIGRRRYGHEHQRRWQRRKRRREERYAASRGRKRRVVCDAQLLDYLCSWQRSRSEQQRRRRCGWSCSWQRRDGSGRRRRASSSHMHGACFH
jgi:hypothetical protein